MAGDEKLQRIKVLDTRIQELGRLNSGLNRRNLELEAENAKLREDSNVRILELEIENAKLHVISKKRTLFYYLFGRRISK